MSADMATIEEAFFARTTTYAETLALIGTRVYPGVIPQDATLPALAYQKIGSLPVRSHSGFSNLTETRLQVTCQGNTYASVKAVVVALRHCWESFKGAISGLDIVGFVENEIDGAGETVVRVDLKLWHNGV